MVEIVTVPIHRKQEYESYDGKMIVFDTNGYAYDTKKIDDIDYIRGKEIANCILSKLPTFDKNNKKAVPHSLDKNEYDSCFQMYPQRPFSAGRGWGNKTLKKKKKRFLKSKKKSKRKSRRKSKRKSKRKQIGGSDDESGQLSRSAPDDMNAALQAARDARANRLTRVSSAGTPSDESGQLSGTAPDDMNAALQAAQDALQERLSRVSSRNEQDELDKKEEVIDPKIKPRMLDLINAMETGLSGNDEDFDRGVEAATHMNIILKRYGPQLDTLFKEDELNGIKDIVRRYHEEEVRQMAVADSLEEAGKAMMPAMMTRDDGTAATSVKGSTWKIEDEPSLAVGSPPLPRGLVKGGKVHTTFSPEQLKKARELRLFEAFEIIDNPIQLSGDEETNLGVRYKSKITQIKQHIEQIEKDLAESSPGRASDKILEIFKILKTIDDDSEKTNARKIMGLPGIKDVIEKLQIAKFGQSSPDEESLEERMKVQSYSYIGITRFIKQLCKGQSEIADDKEMRAQEARKHKKEIDDFLSKKLDAGVSSAVPIFDKYMAQHLPNNFEGTYLVSDFSGIYDKIKPSVLYFFVSHMIHQSGMYKKALANIPEDQTTGSEKWTLHCFVLKEGGGYCHVLNDIVLTQAGGADDAESPEDARRNKAAKDIQKSFREYSTRNKIHEDDSYVYSGLKKNQSIIGNIYDKDNQKIVGFFHGKGLAPILIKHVFESSESDMSQSDECCVFLKKDISVTDREEDESITGDRIIPVEPIRQCVLSNNSHVIMKDLKLVNRFSESHALYLDNFPYQTAIQKQLQKALAEIDFNKLTISESIIQILFDITGMLIYISNTLNNLYDFYDITDGDGKKNIYDECNLKSIINGLKAKICALSDESITSLQDYSAKLNLYFDRLNENGYVNIEEIEIGDFGDILDISQIKRDSGSISLPQSYDTSYAPSYTPSYTPSKQSQASSVQSKASSIPQSKASSVPQSKASSIPQSKASSLPQSKASSGIQLAFPDSTSVEDLWAIIQGLGKGEGAVGDSTETKREKIQDILTNDVRFKLSIMRSEDEYIPWYFVNDSPAVFSQYMNGLLPPVVSFKDVTGDGNCFYYALAAAILAKDNRNYSGDGLLNAPPDKLFHIASDYRQKMADFIGGISHIEIAKKTDNTRIDDDINRERDHFILFIEESRRMNAVEFADRIRPMENPEWAEEAEIAILAYLLNIQIVIHSPGTEYINRDRGVWPQGISIIPEQNPNQKGIFHLAWVMGSGLASTAGNHYCAYLPSNARLYSKDEATPGPPEQLGPDEVLEENIKRMNEMAFMQYDRRREQLPEDFNMVISDIPAE